MGPIVSLKYEITVHGDQIPGVHTVIAIVFV